MSVLVVDDSRAMRAILRRLVTSVGYDVVEADNGRSALEALGAMEQPPQAALVDWNMPEMNGLEFIGAVRAQPQWRDIALMMVTTESDPNQIVRALAAGAHEYLIKPFTPEVIRDKLAILGVMETAAA
ncbi:response regulator [Couchioplanes caeruleus]|uniref:Histidine kinase n=2 Tax=Couchioplanes caeruleus TaxID=56438 RepID=A0A1K0FKI5_9ACTN|nr:response regulator [Couchioplanes caeruleus]OJF13367.1 histidine kinase [Couchioplanes caeruleus subsp. caeruleus]ROP33578.1 two-component system chemotaxis response regulator CheY [Couchioplanes caeruleus]